MWKVLKASWHEPIAYVGACLAGWFGLYLGIAIDPAWLGRAGSLIIVCGVLLAMSRKIDVLHSKAKAFLEEHSRTVARGIVLEEAEAAGRPVPSDDEVGAILQRIFAEANSQVGVLIDERRRVFKLHEVTLVIVGTVVNGFGEWALRQIPSHLAAVPSPMAVHAATAAAASLPSATVSGPPLLDVRYWVLGLGFAVLVGGIVTSLFVWLLRAWTGAPKATASAEEGRSVPPWLTGVVERLFFAVLVGLSVPGAPAAMMGWLALKLATNWNHSDVTVANARPLAFTALLGGVVSMLFALVGGLICAGVLSVGI
jgi:hypothetical protein